MYGPCLSTIGGGQALTSPKRHSLGKPLPYQLADTPQANPQAINLYRIPFLVLDSLVGVYSHFLWLSTLALHLS